MYTPASWLNSDNRPAWCNITAAGRFSVSVHGGRFERHYHDGPELWFVSSGKARIRIGADESYVGTGDIVLTRAGDVHDIVEVYETLTGFFCETETPIGGRSGHLYVDEADATGHDVRALPLPADFPAR